MNGETCAVGSDPSSVTVFKRAQVFIPGSAMRDCGEITGNRALFAVTSLPASPAIPLKPTPDSISTLCSNMDMKGLTDRRELVQPVIGRADLADNSLGRVGFRRSLAIGNAPIMRGWQCLRRLKS